MTATPAAAVQHDSAQLREVTRVLGADVAHRQLNGKQWSRAVIRLRRTGRTAAVAAADSMDKVRPA